MKLTDLVNDDTLQVSEEHIKYQRLKGKTLPESMVHIKTGEKHPSNKYKVKKYTVSHCPNISTLINSPRVVNGLMEVISCESLTSLEGAPIQVMGLVLSDLPELKTLQHIPHVIGGLEIDYLPSLTSFKYLPKSVGNFTISGHIPYLKSIKEIFDIDIAGHFTLTRNGMEDELYQALTLMKEHKNKGTKNYLEIMKDARIKGLEGYFK